MAEKNGAVSRVEPIVAAIQMRLAKYPGSPVSAVDMLIQARRREVTLEELEERQRSAADQRLSRSRPGSR